LSTLTLTPPVSAARSHLPRLKEAPVAHSRAARVTRLGQVVLGLLWLMDGLLQFQPYMFGKTFITGVLLPNAVGQPGIIASPITWIANLIEPHVVIFNAFAATLQVLIGLGLLYRRTVKPALLASFGWAIGIWFTGEGLGMIFTGGANPLTGAPGAALLYILAGVICWPRAERSPERTARARIKAYGLLGEHRTRLAWTALWLGSAVLWLLPANSSANATHDAIAAVPSGAGWLTSILNTAADATAGHGTAIAIVMAAHLGSGRPRGPTQPAHHASARDRRLDLADLLGHRTRLRGCPHRTGHRRRHRPTDASDRGAALRTLTATEDRVEDNEPRSSDTHHRMTPPAPDPRLRRPPRARTRILVTAVDDRGSVGAEHLFVETLDGEGENVAHSHSSVRVVPSAHETGPVPKDS